MWGSVGSTRHLVYMLGSGIRNNQCCAAMHTPCLWQQADQADPDSA